MMFSRNMLKAALILFSLTLVFSCTQKGQNLLPSESQQLDGSKYASKVDNFLVVFDTSSSMDQKYNGNKKMDIAKRIAKDMNIALPEMGQTAGLRTFGHSQQVSKKSTELFYGMEKYSSASFSGGLKEVAESGGTTPLSKAINAAAGDFEELSGAHNALIVISDGIENGGSSEEKATLLKEQYGTSLCIYTVLVGDAPEGEDLMKKLVSIGDCGFSVTADQLLNAGEMKDFVEKVFLAEKPAPKVVAPAPVPEPEPVVVSVPKDSDNDGVIDDKDKCPGTPIGAHVNIFGCWVLEQVLFGNDKAILKTEAYPFLDDVVEILNKNQDMNVTLQGHTDATGSAEYNQGLSLKRANAVKKYLVNKEIAASRLEAKGSGETEPISSNDTETGRAFNRRVAIHPK